MLWEVCQRGEEGRAGMRCTAVGLTQQGEVLQLYPNQIMINMVSDWMEKSLGHLCCDGLGQDLG